MRARWKTFSNKFQVKPIEGTFNVLGLTESDKNAWISRINIFNNLFGDGALKGANPRTRNPNWTWQYTEDMFERFITYVKDQLANEIKKY